MSVSSRAFRTVARAAFVAAAFLAQPVTSAFADQAVTVFAAASLKEVLGDISTAWKAETGKETSVSFAASSALAKQIQEGAPADIFLSADLKWMDYLDKAGLIAADTRSNLLGNRIVLVAPKDSTVTTKIAEGFPLKDLLAGGKLAMGNTESVPAGLYGKAALEKLGVWDSVKTDIAQSDSVRAALLLVSRAEAPLGIVYETDAKADKEVKVVDRFPEDSHPEIVYPAALLKESKNADAKAFLEYLHGAKAQEIFTAAGFTVLSKTN
ncbi:molybdate ABC transporter substrate-binding protein [Rhizobium sp. S153]|uniref:Molybdate ABC transporter substrate-binding protein n=1 Tax=Ciceribacter sichuanensis TaxID=2949647 RepID=A0ABT0VAS6_9HYPH|nr:molybdate ABC transporter substrate-binding protein [Ciceribacter sp. S153]MCM2402946.1 molybdate ABC transporter substrate-binding protein [Ciceribacter sp. S153]